MKLLDVHLGKPLTRGALTIFPTWNGRAVASRGYDVHSDHLAVDERAGSAVVAELVVTNSGPRPVLLLEGELLEGGQQHRVAARSVLVGAGAAQVLDVRCVEQGRWSGGAAHGRSGRRAPLSVRVAEEQHGTWERVHRLEQRYGGSATSSLLDATRSAEGDAAQLVAGIRPLPFQSGVLLCLGGQPVQLEAYDSPRTLATVWESLLQAAALDALGMPPVPTPGRRARRFLSRVTVVPTDRYDAGLGTGVQGRSAYARVDALIWRDRPVHAVAVNTRHQLVEA